MTSPRPLGPAVPGRGEGTTGPAVTTPADPAGLAPGAEIVLTVALPHGSITVDDGVLVLTGDVDTRLCRTWTAQRPPALDVHAVDAREVTFLGSPGLALLAELAEERGTRLPLWATDRAVLRPLRVTGLDRLFDVHRPD